MEKDDIQTLLKIGNQAVKEAQKENILFGLPNDYVIDGTVVYKLPDGSVTTKNPLDEK